MWTALATLLVGIITAAVTSSQGEKNRQAIAAQEEKQNEYNKEAIELQSSLNRQAAKESYEYETNYQDRMNKLMSTGITSWKAADILGGSTTSVQPAQVSVNQALKKEPTDMSPLNAILGQIPNLAGQMEDRKLAKDQQQVDNEYKKMELQIRKDALEVQKLWNQHKISLEDARENLFMKAQNYLVTNPVDPSGPKIPLFLASALEKGEGLQYDYKLKKNAFEMNDEQLKEFKVQVKRNETLFEKQIEAMADRHKISTRQYQMMKYSMRILKAESSPKWLNARYELLNAQKLRAQDGQEINSIIDNLPVNKNTKAGLKVGFKLIKSLFD